MKTAKNLDSVRRRNRHMRRPQPEKLEARTLLDARPANVFAGFEGALSSTKLSETIRVHLTTQNFNLGASLATLGFELRAAEGSNLAPRPIAINPLNPGNAPTIDARAGLPGGRSLTLAKLRHGEYDLNISGVNNSVGTYELRIFLAGDVNGDFAVTDADIALLNDAVDTNNRHPSFLAEGDANRDGQITGYDLARARENRGVSTTIRILTVSAGLDPASDTGILGDNLVNHTPVNIVGLTVPGAQVTLDKDGNGYNDGSTIATALTSGEEGEQGDRTITHGVNMT